MSEENKILEEENKSLKDDYAAGDSSSADTDASLSQNDDGDTSDDDVKEYKFVREETKKRPVDKRGIAVRAGKAVLCGAVFGIAAAFMIWLFGRILPEKEQERQTDPVSFSDESGVSPEVSGTGENAADVSAGGEQNEQGETTGEEEPDQAGDGTGEGSGEDPDGETPAEAPEIDPETILSEMTPADYERVIKDVYAIGGEAAKSVVDVTGTGSGRGWFESDAEGTGASFGVIILKNDETTYILTDSDFAEYAETITVSFGGEASAAAVPAASDPVIGIAVITVANEDIPEEILSRYEPVELGSSLAAEQGDFLIAIGSPLGSSGSVAVGEIISTDDTLAAADANYKLITADLSLPESGEGVVLGLGGEMVGVLSGSDARGNASIIGISEISDVLENLSNGKRTAYSGIYISSLYSSADTDDSTPGIYVASLAEDSPAMTAGIQAGDIIEGINDTEIHTESQYESFMAQTAGGDEITLHVRRLGTGNEYMNVDCQITLGER